jgi:hypothetical protein
MQTFPAMGSSCHYRNTMLGFFCGSQITAAALILF